MILLSCLIFCLTFATSSVATLLTLDANDPILQRGARDADNMVNTWTPVKLRGRAKQEMQREILNLLGLQHRPKPRLIANSQNSSAPKFMLDLYRSLNSVDADSTDPGDNNLDLIYPSPGSGGNTVNTNAMQWMSGTIFNYTMNEVTALNQADTIMSLPVNYKKSTIRKHGRHRYQFDVTRIPETEIVTTAELRIFRYTSPNTRRNNNTYRLSVYQIIPEVGEGQRERQFNYLDGTLISKEDTGWLVLDVTTASNTWQAFPEEPLLLQIRVESLQGEELDPSEASIVGVDNDEDKAPFMVIFFRSSTEGISPHIRKKRASSSRNRRKSRRKSTESDFDSRSHRQAADSLAMKSQRECQKRALYVSFRDLGWDDWIIAPEGYSAYYCHGECAFPLNAHLNATNHAIVQTLVHLMSPQLVPEPCCAPTKLTAISVLYFDEGSNVVLKKYRNMVVRACGCH